MSLLVLREPASALTHGLGLILAIAAAKHLWTRSLSDPVARVGEVIDTHRYRRGRSFSLFIFGATLAFCYAASTLFHAAPVSGVTLHSLHRIDHVGIYLLIAGTYTPIAWSLFRGPWRWGTLGTVWSIALLCSIHILDDGTPPLWISTSCYLALGWGALFCYRELRRTYSHAMLASLPLGGVFYSVGALFNALHWPTLVPGVFGPHAVFHLFVIAGSACHVWFMLRIVIPAREPSYTPPRLEWKTPSFALVRIPADPQARATTTQASYGLRAGVAPRPEPQER